ncbi:bifunctional UDP-N-acetylglucosamine diphosphorylase/glucosamine-1-phosphate N-acetyltransferase GlmU [Lichenicoccus roseus]|uniref:Bifunctional protein GlmU n=1 Tax=Lichenicoccus roseus TaxID=2683649 RepID=A0A5R9J7S6_9PROT|nr:bifunctional UDP-N-acetylglucosamine diphosphorylase/glucosamine-1-phosphate N-acetyltransferase GlmU [Lichenicoccus roseus]TLU72567.1 bifunctional UDP-N-acetylglucosamine diphosphorylase/glucosamine-1-phosphate N-acetyltransferase GlmU [Lichenicoccus roseus]
MHATAILLAAGLGTRMKSRHPKAAHKLAGRPMLRHLIESCGVVFDQIVVVVGPDMQELEAIASPHAVVVQQERLGTAHAALQAAGLFGDGDVAVLYADNPLITPDTLRRLVETRRDGATRLALLAMRPADPGRYGRVVQQDGEVERIVEWADASEAERAIPLCNAGVLCAAAADFEPWLRAVRNDNARGEYYLTDVVALAAASGGIVRAVEASEAELRGINSRAELAEGEAAIQQRLRRAAMDAGATLVAPETVFLSADTVLAPDVVVQPHVVFGPGVSVGAGSEIRAFSHLEGCIVGEGAQIGPYARLRPGTHVGDAAHVGNFVELKAADLGAGAKANHLSYIGDASIGAGSNIGAGTITCNYDGVFKHRTEIGARAFIGSNSILVAPVRIGDGALTAAGSVITNDVEADALALGRARQVNKPGQASMLREKLARETKVRDQKKHGETG